MLKYLKKQKKFTAIILLILVGFAVYANTLGADLFWDDDDFVVNNVFIREFALGKFFSENLIAGAGLVSNYWRPALMTVFSLEWQVWGNWSPGFHFVSFAFHIAAGVMLFLLLLKVFRNKILAFFSALVFLIHPLQTEAVAYVSSLGDSLSVFLMLCGLVLFFRDRENGKKFSVWSMVFYVLALMSKETAVIMPGLAFLVDFFRVNDPGQTIKKKFINSFKASLPLFIFAVIYVILRGSVLNFKNSFNLYDEQTEYSSDIIVRIQTFFRITLVYFRLMIAPFGLHMERSVEVAKNFFALDVVGGFVLVFGLLTTAVLKIKKHPIISFGIFWFFVSIFPTSNIIIPINGMLYEHWLYLPLVGIFIAGIYSFVNVSKKYRLYRFSIWLLVVYMVVFSVLAIKRNNDWRDPVRFYRQTITYAPESYRLWNNFGMELGSRGRHEEAVTAYEQAIKIAPDIAVAYHNLANSMRDTERFAMAEKYYKQSLSADPNFLYSLNSLLSLYLNNNQYDLAFKFLSEKKEYESVLIQAIPVLAQKAIVQNDLDSALAYVEYGLKISPQNTNLKEIYLRLRQTKNQ